MFGVLNLNKPQDVTSRDVVNIVQRLVKPVKVGHAGTLDPMATGVLLVCLGGATRLISLLQKSSKTYVAEFTLGRRSDTDDSTGQVEEVPVSSPPELTEIQAALQTYAGNIEQIPPAFSAVKVDGERAYSKARRGEGMELKAKSVIVHSIELVSFSWPKLKVEIECGTGTYIRSIARDLGKQLGCGGLMSSLERTRIGSFSVDTGVDAETLSVENLNEMIHDPVKIITGLPQYRCADDDLANLKAGRRISVVADRRVNHEAAWQERIALTSSDGQKLLAMADSLNDGTILQPRIVFAK